MATDTNVLNLEREMAKLALVREVSGYRSLSDLVEGLPAVFRDYVDFIYIGLSVVDLSAGLVHFRGAVQTEVPEGTIPAAEDEDVREIYVRGLPIRETPVGELAHTGEPYYVPNLNGDSRYPRVFGIYRRHGAQSLLYLPLRTPRAVIGAVFFASARVEAFAPDTVHFLREVAEYLALAVENTLNIESLIASEQGLARERNQLELMVRIAEITARQEIPAEMIRDISGQLRPHLDFQFCAGAEYDRQNEMLEVVYLDSKLDDGSYPVGTRIPLAGTISGAAFQEGRTLLLRRKDPGPYKWSEETLRQFNYDWICAVPLVTADGVIGMFYVGGLEPQTPTAEGIVLLERVASLLALAMQRAFHLRDVLARNEQLVQENTILHDEIRAEINFEEIIGRSKRLRDVLQQAEVVASTDATVLIQGESGTGKELIARAIHRRSARKSASFVKVNCAAIPAGLLESELFGHEKGAFTGALSRKPGRFEVANGGTLFLDEIGELPLELQPKLLRVLQDQEFERLGSNKTLNVNVRVIAATNRDLRAMVASGRFREDLFYRISVFPIAMPPLRDREGDIPLLIRYFVEKSSRRLGRQVTRIPEAVSQAMQRYPWPGNVREMENFIERAVILSAGPVLNAPLAELSPGEVEAGAAAVTLEEAERRIIRSALEECRWVVGGSRGAAARLGMKRTTLQSRMLKLGITRPKDQ